MSDKASIYLHIDYKIGQYVKVIMDEIFGEDSVALIAFYFIFPTTKHFTLNSTFPCIYPIRKQIWISFN